MGIGQANGDSFGGGEEGDANDDGRNDQTGAENSASNSGEKALADVMRAVQRQNPKMSYGDVVKVALSMATGNLPGIATEAVGMVNKAIAAGAKTKSDLRSMGFSDAQIADMESAAKQISSSKGAAGQSSGSTGGDGVSIDAGGGLYDLLASGQPVTGDATTANTTPSLADQIGGMFTGANAPYNMQDLMTAFTGGVGKAAGEYDTANRTLADKWQNFVSDFDKRYESMSKQYDDLNTDFDSVRGGQQELAGDWKNNSTKYDELLKGYYQKASNLPQVSLTLPGSMGGSSFAMAPKNWNNIYSQQANTAANILGGQQNSLTGRGTTLADQLATINSKRTAYDSKAGLLQPWASSTGTGIINQGTTDQNRMNATIAALQEQFKPFGIGYETYDTDKRIAANQALQTERIDAASPNDFDRWAPVAAAAMPAVVDLGKGLIDSLSKINWGG